HIITDKQLNVHGVQGFAKILSPGFNNISIFVYSRYFISKHYGEMVEIPREACGWLFYVFPLLRLAVAKCPRKYIKQILAHYSIW
ncbi:MAG: hypothetical protein J6B26_08370, partial [Agathobacter sp.]|nr:hypothetical protein [Agathobacter sp.]